MLNYSKTAKNDRNYLEMSCPKSKTTHNVFINCDNVKVTTHADITNLFCTISYKELESRQLFVVVLLQFAVEAVGFDASKETERMKFMPQVLAVEIHLLLSFY